MLDLLGRVFPGKKTFIAIGAGVVLVVSQFYVGDINASEMINQLVLLSGIGGLRLAKK